ncbi:rIIB protector from prophage-induced early lysis protein [Rhizobium phage RHph_X66]|nr:rIIB protector from prophage-induced early lysis protein [Rhizobium phage RHph_X66]
MAKIRIAAAIGSQHGITLYLEDGREENLPTTSWRTKAILDEVLERLARGEIVEVDLNNYSIEARIEKETNGVVRFAKKTKSFVKGLFGKKDDQADSEVILISPPDPVKPVEPVTAAAPAAPKKVEAPKPVTQEPETQEPETELVAIVTDKKTGEEVVIPGVAALEKHVEAAVLANNVIGLQRFMERLAQMQKQRSHTVKELMRFMERGDLPIAEDGCIVAYKVLKTKDSTSKDLFVDCHSGKVEQRVGSKVMQDESLIDQNRRNECSTGLHIARRGYLGGFSGNIITIVKVAPEDVVAVPDYDANKMRAAAYHIVGLIPEPLHNVLRSNKPMTGNPEAAKILADVIAGRHIGVTEHVRITAAYGGSFTVTPVSDGGEERAGATKVVEFARALDAPVEGLKPADIRAAVEKTIEAEKEKAIKKPLTAAQTAAQRGDLAAAISQPATPAPAPAAKPESKKAAAKPVKTEKKVEKPVVKADTTPAPGKVDKKAEALKLHAEGKSNRQIEAELHICRKTLKKLFDANGLKPNG